MSEARGQLLVDVTTAEHAQGGITVVVAGLLDGLADIGLARETKVIAGPATVVPPEFAVHRVGVAKDKPGQLLYQRALLAFDRALQERRAGGSRMLVLDAYYPLLSLPAQARRTTVFIHDVLALSNPEFFGRPQAAVKRLAFRSIRRHRPALATSCEYTAGQVRECLGMRASVARFGCGQLSDAEADTLLGRVRLGRPSPLLYVGAIERRKDLPTLIRGVWRARKKEPQLTLRVVGNCETPYGRALRTWVNQRAPGLVEFLGRRSQQELLDLLARSRALIYPAVAEGFGLPILEGMAAGIPVIATDLPVFRSWTMDAIRTFPPGDSEALADAIRETGASASRFAERGWEVSRTYRWRTFAQALIETR